MKGYEKIWYPEPDTSDDQPRIIPANLASPTMIGLTISAIGSEVEKAQKAGSTIFLIQVQDKNGQPDNDMASRLSEIARHGDSI